MQTEPRLVRAGLPAVGAQQLQIHKKLLTKQQHARKHHIRELRLTSNALHIANL